MEKARAEPSRILLRLPEAAQALSIGRATIYQLVNRGELPVVRIGRSVRIPVTALEAWAERQIGAGQSRP